MSVVVENTKILQRRLNEALGLRLKVDGIWGPNTSTAALRLAPQERWPGDGLNESTANDAEFDGRTERNLATLRAEALVVVRPFLRQAMAIAAGFGVECKVIAGYRNREDQEKARASGASRAGWGFSWHNYGIAIDLGLFRRGGKEYVDSENPDLAWTIYSGIGEVAPRFGMEWGGSWSSFVDAPHFHVDLGRSTPNREDRRKLAAGIWKMP